MLGWMVQSCRDLRCGGTDVEVDHVSMVVVVWMLCCGYGCVCVGLRRLVLAGA